VPHKEQNRPLAAAPQLGQVVASEVPQDEQNRASTLLPAPHDGQGVRVSAATLGTVTARFVGRRSFG
jgi:hypothetical protein